MAGDLKIVGYIADWQDWSVNKIDAEKLTHINYAFALIKDGMISINSDNKLEELKRLKAKHPGVKILISVGGWGADGFSDAALTEEARKRFSQSVIEFIKLHDFDGLDLDWEYPCSQEAGIKARPEDKHNFTLLLKSIRQELDIEGDGSGREYLLTIASGAMEEHIASLELDKISQIADFINVMTYDFHNGLSSFSGHQANLFTSICDDGDRMSADKAIRNHIKAGVPSEKLVLGFPFYARGWEVNEAVNNGLYEFSGNRCVEFSYRGLIEGCLCSGDYKRYWDEAAKVPYLWDGKTFISYEDAASIGFKAEYIKANGLGGAMFWEYMQDENGILLNKLYTDLRLQPSRT